MLEFDLAAENETITTIVEPVFASARNHEFAMAEQIRAILVQEQDHQIELATALGREIPDVTRPEERG